MCVSKTPNATWTINCVGRYQVEQKMNLYYDMNSVYISNLKVPSIQSMMGNQFVFTSKKSDMRH